MEVDGAIHTKSGRRRKDSRNNKYGMVLYHIVRPHTMNNDTSLTKADKVLRTGYEVHSKVLYRYSLSTCIISTGVLRRVLPRVRKEVNDGVTAVIRLSK